MAPLYDLNLPPYDLKVDSGSSDQHASSSSWCRKEDGDYGGASDHNSNGSSVKWMSSKKRIMNSNCSSPPLADHNNKLRYPTRDTDEGISFSETNNTVRVCSDCNTTTTPLWRSGPRGPKSLCNACGIRRRKARRALEAATAAANGANVVKEKDVTSMKIEVQDKKETKKSRTSHVGLYKTQLKTKSGHNYHHQKQKKLCLKKFALSLSKNSALQRVFPQDVEDAAILLMELSCGIFHT